MIVNLQFLLQKRKIISLKVGHFSTVYLMTNPLQNSSIGVILMSAPKNVVTATTIQNLINELKATFVRSTQLSTTSDKVDTLVGDDTNKSIRTIAAEELAAQLIPANADQALDTLQEIATWIQTHPQDAAAMYTAITNLQTKVTLGKDGSNNEYTTVKNYVEAAIAALNLGNYASAAELTSLASRVTSLEGRPTGTNYVAGDNISISGGNTPTITATYSNASTTKAGLMSAADKTKLNNLASITTAGNNITISGGTIKAAEYTLPKASTTVLGGVKAGTGLAVDSLGTMSVTMIGGKNYVAGDNISISGGTTPTIMATYAAATTTKDGLMSKTDKQNLNSHSTKITNLETAIGGLSGVVLTNTSDISLTASNIDQPYYQVNKSSHAMRLIGKADDSAKDSNNDQLYFDQYFIENPKTGDVFIDPKGVAWVYIASDANLAGITDYSEYQNNEGWRELFRLPTASSTEKGGIKISDQFNIEFGSDVLNYIGPGSGFNYFKVRSPYTVLSTNTTEPELPTLPSANYKFGSHIEYRTPSDQIRGYYACDGDRWVLVRVSNPNSSTNLPESWKNPVPMLSLEDPIEIATYLLKEKVVNALTTANLPTASKTTKGAIKVGTGLGMDGDTLNVTVSTKYGHGDTIDISGDESTEGDGGTGGTINLKGGYSYDGDGGKGGTIDLSGGGDLDSSSPGNGGTINLNGGNGYGRAGNAGTINLVGGTARADTQRGAGGTINFGTTGGTISGDVTFTGTPTFQNGANGLTPTIATASASSNGLMTKEHFSKVTNLASITAAGKNIAISSGTISAESMSSNDVYISETDFDSIMEQIDTIPAIDTSQFITAEDLSQLMTVSSGQMVIQGGFQTNDSMSNSFADYNTITANHLYTSLNAASIDAGTGSNALKITGDPKFTGNVTIGGNATVAGNTRVNGTTTFNGNINAKNVVIDLTSSTIESTNNTTSNMLNFANTVKLSQGFTTANSITAVDLGTYNTINIGHHPYITSMYDVTISSGQNGDFYITGGDVNIDENVTIGKKLTLNRGLEMSTADSIKSDLKMGNNSKITMGKYSTISTGIHSKFEIKNNGTFLVDHASADFSHSKVKYSYSTININSSTFLGKPKFTDTARFTKGIRFSDESDWDSGSVLIQNFKFNPTDNTVDIITSNKTYRLTINKTLTNPRLNSTISAWNGSEYVAASSSTVFDKTTRYQITYAFSRPSSDDPSLDITNHTLQSKANSYNFTTGNNTVGEFSTITTVQGLTGTITGSIADFSTDDEGTIFYILRTDENTNYASSAQTIQIDWTTPIEDEE